MVKSCKCGEDIHWSDTECDECKEEKKECQVSE